MIQAPTPQPGTAVLTFDGAKERKYGSTSARTTITSPNPSSTIRHRQVVRVLSYRSATNANLGSTIAVHSKIIADFLHAGNFIQNIFDHVLHPSVQNLTGQCYFAIQNLNFDE